MNRRFSAAFSLVEVVLAIGVIAFAVVAILGLLPVGLSTNHSSQGETRATQIAQDIFAALENQARPLASPASALNPSAYINQQMTIPEPTASPSPFNQPLNLTGGTYNWGADSDGNLRSNYTPTLPYQVTVTVTPSPATSPTPFNSTYAATVTVRVAWRPVAQNYRDFTRIITRY